MKSIVYESYVFGMDIAVTELVILPVSELACYGSIASGRQMGIFIEDAIPNCVFTRMDCLEKKYPEMFTINQKLDMAYDFCQSNSNIQDFGNGQFFVHIEDLIGSKNIQKFVEYKQILNKWKRLDQLPVTTNLSNTISKDMKKRGFKFVGSTTIYAHIQAIGIVNDHLITCYRYKEVQIP